MITASSFQDLTNPVGRVAMEEHPNVLLGQQGAEAPLSPDYS
jgi:hypothetical protein